MASHLHNQRILRFFLVLSAVVLTIFVYASYSTNSPKYGPAATHAHSNIQVSAEALRSHHNHHRNASNAESDVAKISNIGIRAAPSEHDNNNELHLIHSKNVKLNKKSSDASSSVDGELKEIVYAVRKPPHQHQQQKHHREPTIDDVAAADSGGGGGGVGGSGGNTASEDLPDEDRFMNNDLLEEQYVQNIDNTLGNINNSNSNAAGAQSHDQNAAQQQTNKEQVASADQSPNQLQQINNNNNNNNLNKILDSDVLIPTTNLQKFIENADKILKNMTNINNASPVDSNANAAGGGAGVGVVAAANGPETANQPKDKLQAEDIPEPKIDQGNNLEDNSIETNDEALPPSVVMTIKRPGVPNANVAVKTEEVEQKNNKNEAPKPKVLIKNAFPKKVMKEVVIKSSSSVKPANTTTPRSTYDTSKGVLTEHIYESGHLNEEINIDKVCPKSGDDLKLLILITSAPSHAQARLSIRQTWGHYGTRRDVSIAFMLGRTLNQTLNEALSQENFIYGDLIRGNFIDSYNNLTLKTVSSLEWVDQHCTSAKYVLKTDDDMFINVPNLLKFLDSHANAKHVIFGRLAKKWKPIRNKKSKYYVSPDQFAAAIFPPFTTGPAYVISSDSVHELYVGSLNQVYLKLEDVFTTGIVAQQLGVKRVHVNEFLNRRIAFNPCNIRKTISVHMVKANEQFDLWKKVLDQTTKCK